MNPVAPPTQRMYTFAEVNAVPDAIPVQLDVLGVPKRVPFEALYACQPPYVPPLTPASVVHVRPCIVDASVMLAPPARTASPPVPTVSLSEVVRVPVMLLALTIDTPPEPFEIWPVEFTCVQDTYPTVELPVTVSPLVEVMPAEVSAPVMLAFPPRRRSAHSTRLGPHRSASLRWTNFQ